MCGVFLIYSKKGNALSKNNCIDAARKIFNRGPDNFKFNFFRKNTLFISNTVLSITGANDKSQNLASSKTKNYFLSFNGEIYNYKNFLKNSANFKSKQESDSKILIDLFDTEKHKDIPKLLNGMFAFIVFDQKKDQLLIINDSQGEKNLYYYEDNNFFIVSSTIEPIIYFLKSKKLNLNPLKNYFFTRHYMPLNETCFNNVNLFPNSNFSTYKFKNNKLNFKEYDNPINWISEKRHDELSRLSESEIIEYLDFELNEQAKLMIPQKNFGCIVSGGIDSTLQAYLINKHAISKFNLAINHENKDPIMKNLHKFDKYFKNKITKININKNKYQKLLKSCYNIVSSPLQTHDLPSRLLLSDFFKRKKCKVFFSADGCDELLGGQQVYSHVFKKIVNFKTNHSPYSSVNNLFQMPSQNLSQKFKMLIDTKWKDVCNSYSFIKHQETRNIQSSLFMDYFIQSIGVSNRSNDLICCENSVEPRNIFIQKNILKILINIPLKYKIDFSHKNPEMRQKYILKKIFLKYFDKKLIFKKSGFSGFPNSLKIKSKYKNKVIKFVNYNKNNKKNASYYDINNFNRDLNWKINNVAGFLNAYNGREKL